MYIKFYKQVGNTPVSGWVKCPNPEDENEVVRSASPSFDWAIDELLSVVRKWAVNKGFSEITAEKLSTLYPLEEPKKKKPIRQTLDDR